MLAAYGFGLFPLPRYREHRCGSWRLVRHLPSLADGYVSPMAIEGNRHVLYHRRTPWMSTGMMEQESHAHHVHAARGTVVVAGLGLAMYVHAVAAKPEVERVVVIEICGDVIELMRTASAWDTWPNRGKIVILHADARDPALGAHVRAELDGCSPDYLFADIWERCGQAQAPAEMAEMVRTFQPVSAGWWGQELAFATWARARPGGAAAPATAVADLNAYFADVGVPAPVSPGYAAFCRDAMAMISPQHPGKSEGSALARLWRKMRTSPST